MPSMVRPKGKATDIAYSILGTPMNMRKSKQSRRRKLNRRLDFEDTVRVR